MTRLLLLCFFLGLSLLHSARAADLQFEGDPTFTVGRSKVNLTIPKIINASGANTNSHAMFVQVWATLTPYDGTSLSGYVIGTYSLPALRPGRGYTNRVASVPLKLPPAGTYFTTVTIQESKNTGPIRDYANTAGAITFSAGAEISMEGAGSWTMAANGATITMKAQQVLNSAYGGRSGSLRLELWATQQPYAGGAPQGYLISSAVLSPISAGYWLTNVVKVAPYKAPPGGYYYTTLVVSEYTRVGTSNQFIPRDFVAVPETFYFGGPTADAPKLELDGLASWVIVGKTVKLSVGKVSNPRLGNTPSGALQLKLYGTAQPVTNALPEDAKLLATANLGTLKGKGFLNKPLRTVAFNMPSTNLYFTTFALTETVSPTQTVLQDLLPLKSSAIILSNSPIGINEGIPKSATADMNINIAPPSFALVSSNVYLNVPHIQNYLAWDSGRLFVQLYAYMSPTNTNNVYVIGEREFGNLGAGAVFQGISGPFPYVKPPVPGKYWVLAQFYERVDYETNSGYFRKRFFIFTKQITVK